MSINQEALAALGLPILRDRTAQAEELLKGLQLTDPRLYEALMILSAQISYMTRALSPIATTIYSRTAAASTLIPPTNFNYLLTRTTIRLSWTRPEIIGALIYEIRFGTVSWDSSVFVLRTQSTIVDIPPFVGLEGTFRIKTLNDEGAYSADEAVVDVVVIPPGPVSINAQVIDNNILLQWNPPVVGSYAIDHYEIQRDGVPQGEIRGTFTSFFEVVSAEYLYTIIPVDIADNRGATAEVSLLVNQPPDYVLQDERTSDLSGTRVNALLMDGPQLVVNVPEESWEDHFTTRDWLHPRDQTNAGYPIYIQPTAFTGSYEEIIDFGVILSNVIATIRYNSEVLIASGLMGIIIKISVSDDGIDYTPFVNGASQFLASVRFLKFRFEFTASTDKVLVRIFNVMISIAVKRENDGGEEIADKDDVGGTEVFFNKDFKDIESVTATVKTPMEPFTVVVDFVDIPDPEGFKVFVFDSTGNRVTKVIEWKARGVV